MRHKILPLTIAIASLITLISVAFAAPLELHMTTSKAIYNLGQPWAVSITGNLTLNGSPLSNGLVTVETHNPRGDLILLRTINTGTTPSDPLVEITSMYSSDSAGNPKPSVNVGGSIGFHVTIRNNQPTVRHVLVYIYVQYPNDVPFLVVLGLDTDIDGNQEESFNTYPIEIPGTAPRGTASAYGTILTGLPSADGYAYSIEKKATFQITSSLMSTSSVLSESNYAQIMSAPGLWNVSFFTSSQGGMLGNYTAYASANYNPYLAFQSVIFNVRLITDINGSGGHPDGKCDIMDLALVSSCFGTIPSSPKWKPQADINKDNKVDIVDVAMVSADFGKYGTLP